MPRATWIACRLLPPLLAILLVGCQETPDSSDDESIGSDTQRPSWVARSTPNKKVAVVFIHGIFGSTRGTWTDAKGRSFFTFLQNAQDVGDQVDIYAFGFTSNMFKDGSLNVREAATKLNEYLESSEAWSYDTVVFVTHSMGGLIAMRLLTSRAHRLEQVPLVVMYATPQEGAQIAAISRWLASNNAALTQMVPADGNDFLKGLDEDWRLIPPYKRPAIVCAYETAAVYGIPIVSSVSATRYCDGASSAIGNANHISIVKPDHQEHESVIKLVNALRTYVFGPSNQALLETPDFVTDGEKWVYTVPDENGGMARLVNNSRRTLKFNITQPSGRKLLVLPTTPRSIAPAQTENLSFAFLASGDWKPEYEFKITAPVMGERTVIVRMTRTPMTLVRETSMVNAVVDAVGAYARSPDPDDNFYSLSPKAQRSRVVEVAKNAIDSFSLKTAPEEVKLLLAADVLLHAELSDLSQTALEALQTLNPDIVNAPALRSIAADLYAQKNGIALDIHQRDATVGIQGGWIGPAKVLDIAVATEGRRYIFTQLSESQREELWQALSNADGLREDSERIKKVQVLDHADTRTKPDDSRLQ